MWRFCWIMTHYAKSHRAVTLLVQEQAHSALSVSQSRTVHEKDDRLWSVLIHSTDGLPTTQTQMNYDSCIRPRYTMSWKWTGHGALRKSTSSSTHTDKQHNVTLSWSTNKTRPNKSVMFDWQNVKRVFLETRKHIRLSTFCTDVLNTISLLLRQLAADTTHTINTTTQKIYRNKKFKKQAKTHYNL